MTSHDRIAGALLIAAISFATACTADSTGPLPQARPLPRGAAPVAARVNQKVRTLDDEWADVARGQVPGFAGYYLDASGVAVVQLADSRRRAAAQSYVLERLRAQNIRARGVRVERATYGFDRLQEWRDALLELGGTNGFVSLDIAEDSNRIRVGVSHDAAAADVRAEIARRSIPAAAVQIVREAPTELRLTLQQRFRPWRAGFQIQFAETCTIGFSAKEIGSLPGADLRLITASHCTPAFNALDYEPMYQATCCQSNNFIGSEIYDPSANRQSDAATFEAHYDTPYSADFGRIARALSHGQGQPGTLTVNDANPYWTITSRLANPDQTLGYRLNKVGRTSGWTRGQITGTCRFLGGKPCQYVATIYSDGGDSGSPIFADESQSATPAGNTAAAAGILWGGPSGDVFTTYYSPIDNVMADLGTQLRFCANASC